MLMSQASCFFLFFTVTVISALHAEPCTRNGSVVICNMTSLGNESLEYVTRGLNNTDNVHIDISVGSFHLARKITFKHLNFLAISGDPISGTNITCDNLDFYHGGAGMTFLCIKNLTLNNFTIIGCGSVFTLTRNTRKKKYSSALRLHQCSNAYIENLVIIKSRGIGLTITEHRRSVQVIKSNFTENVFLDDSEDAVTKNMYGGGGVYIGELNDSIAVSFKFEHCFFSNNIAYTRRYYSFYTNEFGEERTGQGRGGGVFVALENIKQQKNISVSIKFCRFEKNNAFLGGGFSIKIEFVKYQESLKTKIVVSVQNSVFDSNGCDGVNARIGGGFHLSYNSYNYLNIITNIKYILQNVSFLNNCAEIGGGVHVNSHIWLNSTKSSLLFDNCTFEGNHAHTGSAIDMAPYIFTRITTGHTAIAPTFRDCKFNNNTVLVNSGFNNIQKIAGSGTLYVSLFDIRFEGINNFDNNKGTPIYIVNGIIDFINSSALFKNNSGIRGGAIALIGLSSVIVGPNQEYRFFNNRAEYQGGAIFAQMIDTHDFTFSKSCFIQYHNGTRIVFDTPWKNTVTFIGNNASFGAAIYVTSLHSCQQIKIGRKYITVNASKVCSSRGIKVDESAVETEGAQIQREHKSDVLYAIPGKQLNHNMTVRDDTNKIVDEPLRATINSENVVLDPSLSSYVRKSIQFRGKPGERANISLQTVSTRHIYTTFEVELIDCPPGFKLKTDRCICSATKYYGLIDYCDHDKFQTYLTPGLWTGIVNHNEMVTSICPQSFCDYNQSDRYDQLNKLGIALPTKGSELDEKMCGKTRTGVLCGTCRQGYSVHFHSPKYQCKQTYPHLCKLGWLFYIISEIVPVTVVFISVIVLNISFTSGRVNGFILFSQILLSLNIDASGLINFPNQRTITEGYQFLYGFLNLDFFAIDSLSFCLWKKATALDMLAFKYITIVYALSLVILVIWFMNKCGGSCLGKWCRITAIKSSIIHGISAFLIICYSQTVSVSSNLVNGVDLWPEQGSNSTLSKRVWLDGNMIYFSASHLPYALPAIFCLVTIGIIPPILLLAYPLLNKVLTLLKLEEYKLVTCISKILPISSLKPLLDCFQSCFKDNLRFFAGLYFLYRWIAPVVYTTSSTLGTSYIITEIFLILILAIHAFSQPYVKQAHNMIDTILFTDLLLINSITCIHYFLFQSQENYYTVYEKVAKTSIIQATLIYLPFIAMLVYLLLLGCRHLYILWYTKVGYQRNYFFPKAGVHGDDKEYELPHRLLSENISYEKFENTSSAIETY